MVFMHSDKRTELMTKEIMSKWMNVIEQSYFKAHSNLLTLTMLHINKRQY